MRGCQQFMGYNITFHPIKLEELQYYVFDVLRDFTRAESRVSAISDLVEKQERIRTLYAEWPEMILEIEKGNASFAANVAYPACVIAGFLHPYWYAEDGCITFLSEEERSIRMNPVLKLIGKKGPSTFKPLLMSLKNVSPESFSTIEDETFGMIFGNYTASGFVSHDKLEGLKLALTDKKNAEIVNKILNDKAKRALNAALDYAIINGCGLMEASEVYIDKKNLSFSDRTMLKP